MQVSVCLALIILPRLARNSFFRQHQILRCFFEEQISFLDDTMKVLLDFATPNRFVEAFVDDASNGLPFSRLPSCLPLLQDVWRSWCRRNSLTAEITSAYLLFRSWLLGNGQRVVPTSQIYDAMETCARLTFWTEDEVNRAVQEEAAMRSERMENLCGQEEHHLEMPVSQPTSPVSVSAETERRFCEMSSNDACHGGVSPLRGDESPPHKRFHAELSVDPDVEIFRNSIISGNE